MKKTLLALLLAACACPALAQAQDQAAQPDQAKAESQQKKRAPKAAKAQAEKTAAVAAQPAAQAPQAQPAAAKRPAAAAPKPAEQEPEESVVMIDSKGDQEETGRFSAGSARGEQEEAPAAPGGMPSSYGQLKGVMNEAGRTLLVLESPDDGTITFVQVIAGRNGVAWKLVDRIPRSMD
jgi:hypothetical protein